MQIDSATVEFRISAVIVQIGGHYLAMIEKKGEWFEISDVQIRRMSAARSE
jgi:ubiquitin C-terminal hydrolase